MSIYGILALISLHYMEIIQQFLSVLIGEKTPVKTKNADTWGRVGIFLHRRELEIYNQVILTCSTQL